MLSGFIFTKNKIIKSVEIYSIDYYNLDQPR